MSSALLARLAADAPALNLAAVEEEYRDPFWMARFGERGRKHATEDGLHHFSYVAEAVAAGDLAIVENYARWLRSVLVPRGMCSAHLADSFTIRGRLLRETGWEGVAAAAGAFDAAARALVRTEGPAGALEAQAAALAADLPGARHLVSYLIDSLAMGDRAIFANHVRWLVGQDAEGTGRLYHELRRRIAGLPLPEEVLHFFDVAAGTT